MRISDWSSDVCSSDLPGDVDHLPGRADGTAGCVRRGLRGRDHRPALRREVRACRVRVRMLPRRGRGGRAVAGRIELPAGLGPAAHADDRRPRGLAGEGGAGRRPDPALRPDRGRGRVRHDQGAHGVGRGRPRAVPQRCAAGVEPTRASTDRGRARRRRRLDGQGLHAGPADAGRGRAVAGCGVRRRHAPARLLERGRPAASPGTACAPRQGAAVFHRPHPGLGGTTRGGCDVSLYEKTFRHLLYPGYEAVRGRRTLHYLREHEASQWLPPGQIAELQWRKLTSLVGHCWEQVPYYRQRWQEIGFEPGDLKSMEDYARLPVLTKADIRANFDRLKARNLQGQLLYKATGGSTGEPLRFGYTRESYERRTAVMWRGYGWTGATLGRRALYLWGGAVGEQSRATDLKERLYHRSEEHKSELQS